MKRERQAVIDKLKEDIKCISNKNKLEERANRKATIETIKVIEAMYAQEILNILEGENERN